MGVITPLTLAMGQADLYYLTTTREPNVFKYYVVPGGEVINHGPPDVRGRISVDPEDWQVSAMQNVHAQIPLFFNLRVEETLDRNTADYELVFSATINTCYVSGMRPNQVFTQSLYESDVRLSMDTIVGLPFENGAPVPGAVHNDITKVRWENVYIHELGHMLGLEHPFDKFDNDWAAEDEEVATLAALSPETRMSRNDFNQGRDGFFQISIYRRFS